MPHVKCRYYTDSGEERDGGCRRRNFGCAFIHPGETGWGTAPSANSSLRSRGGGPARGGGSSRGKSSTDAGRAGGFLATKTVEPSKRGRGESSGGWETGASTGGWDSGGRDTVASGWDTGAGGWDTCGAGTSNQGRSMEGTSTGWATSVAWDSTTTEKPDKGQTESSESWGGGGGASGWGSQTDASLAAGKTGQGKGRGDATSLAGWGNPASDWGMDQSVRYASPEDSWTKSADSGWASATPAVTIGTVWADDDRDGNNQNLSNDEATKRKATAQRITGTNQVPLGTKIKWGENLGSTAITPKDTSSSDPTTLVQTKPFGIRHSPPPPPPPLKLQLARPIADQSETVTPLTPATPSVAAPRLKRKREGTDEKYEVIKEYVKTWERAVRAKFQYVEAEVQRARWYRTQKSPTYARIGDAGIAILEGKRAEFDKECHAQRDKYYTALSSLVSYHDTVMTSLDLGQRYNVNEEASKFFGECMAYITDLRTTMQDLKNHDVPMREPSPVPTEKGSPPPPDWWEAIKHRMEEMEESLEQIDAELTLTRQPDVREMVDKLFERRLAAVREVRKQEAEKMARQSPPEIVLPPGCLQTIKENTERWREIEARQLTAIRGISDLITEIGQLKNKLESMEKEATEERQIFAKVHEERVRKRAANEELCRQKAKLEKDLETFMCRPRLEPPVSAEDSSQKLIKELERTIEEVVQKMWEVEVAPTVKTMGDVVVETSNQRLEDLFRAMWQTLGPTMDMVEGVSRWLDSQELSLTAPRE